MPDKQYENPKSVGEALASYGGGSHLTITEFSPDPSYVGHTIADLAKVNNIPDVEMYIRLIREGDAAHTEAEIIGQSMIESDIKAFYEQLWVMVASDGGVPSQHPRGAGTFPRVLGLYVREKHWLTLPEAIRKMTSPPARRLGWKPRGTETRGVCRFGAVRSGHGKRPVNIRGPCGPFARRRKSMGTGRTSLGLGETDGGGAGARPRAQRRYSGGGELRLRKKRFVLDFRG